MALNILLEASPLDNGTPTTIRMSLAAVLSDGVQVDQLEWLPVITTAPSLQFSVSEGSGQIGPMTVSMGSVSFRIGKRYANREWNKLSWVGAPVALWIGETDKPFSSYRQFFTGTLSGMARTGNVAELALRTVEGQLDVPLLSKRYAGTGGPEGPPGKKGTLKPYCLGNARIVSPVEVDPARLVYQVHGYGPVADIPQVYEFAQPLEASKGDVATWDQLVAADLKPGEWMTCKALGMFRLGGRPDKKLSADVLGGSLNGTAPMTIAGIVPLLLQAAGVSPQRIGDMSALNFQWSFYATETVSIADVVKQAALDAGGYILADRKGVWQCGRHRTPKAPGDLLVDRTAEPLVQTINELNVTDPTWKVEVGYDRCWSVHSESDISPKLTELEGKIVAADEVLEDLKEQADEAVAAASAAKAEIDAMLADGILDRSDKRRVIDRLEAERVRHDKLEGVYSAYSVASQWADYDTAWKSVEAYVTGLTPSIYDNSANTPVDRATYLSQWAQYENTLQTLLNKITGRSSQTASWPLVSGDGKPENYATVGAPVGTPVAGVPAETVVDAVKDNTGTVKPAREQIADAKAIIDAAVSKAQGDATKAQNDLAAAKTSLATDIAAAKKAGDDASAQAAQVRTDLVPTIADAKKAGTDAAAAAQQVRTDLVPTIDAAKKAGTDAAAQASQISTDLSAEVSRAKGAEGTLTTKVETAQRTADGAVTSISTETTQRTQGDTALGQRIDTLKTTVDGNTTAISSEVTARSDAITAVGQRIDSLTTTVGSNTTAITTEQKARSDGDGALGQRIDSVVTQATTDRADYTAKINTEQTARSDGDGALGRRVDEVVTQANTDRGNLNTRISDEATASSNRDAALGNRTQVLESGFAGVSKLVLNENFDNGIQGWTHFTDDMVVPASRGRLNVVRTPVGSRYDGLNGRRIPIQYANQFFKLRTSFRCVAGTSVYWFGVQYFDANGNSYGNSDGTGNYPLAHNFYVDSASNSDWINREDVIGSGFASLSQYGGTRNIPAGAAYFRPIIFINYSNDASSVTELDYFTVEDVTDVYLTSAAVKDEATTRAAQDGALSNRIATTEAQFRGEQDSTIAARIRDEATASANRDSALGQRVDSVTAQANTDRSDLNTRITNEATASANRDAAIGSRTQILESTATRLNDMALKTFPGFEVQADGWGYDTQLRGRNNGSAWETHHTKGAGISFPPGFGNFLYMDPYGWIKTTPGKRYRAGFWVWQWSAPNGYGGNARVYYEGQNKDHTDSSYLGITANAPETQRNFYEAIPNGAWHLYAFDYQVDDTTVSTASSYWIRPRINIDNAPAGAGYVIAGWFCREVTGEFSNAAKISDEATTRANQDSALGNRISTTEAQMRGDQDSWLAARVRDEATASSNRDGALGNRIGSVEASYTTGGNLLSNTDFAYDATGWNYGQETATGAGRDNITGNNWWPAGLHALVIGQENNNGNRAGYYVQDVWGIEAGKNYQATVYGASHRCAISIYIDCYDRVGNFLGTTESQHIEYAGNDNYAPLTSWWRHKLDFVTPANTSRLRYHLMKYGTTSGGNSYAWFIRPQLVQTRPGFTGTVPYVPGSGDMGNVAANSRISDEATASANRDGALSNRVSNTEAKLNGDQDSTLAARIRDEATASANRDSALGGRTSSLETSVSLIPETWRVRSFGNAAQGANRIAGLFRPDGYQIGETRRSYGVVAFAPGSNTAVLTSTFDVYGEGAAADGRGSLSMAQTLNGIPDGNTVIIYTCDEPYTHRFDNGLGDAMARCGAGEAYFASNFPTHCAYVLIGRAGIGRGNGTEYYTGGYNADPNAYLEIPFTLTAGRAAVGANGGSRALSTKLADEQTARTTADNALGNRISTTEAQFRGEQDSWVAGRIRDEASASSNRDSALSNRISTTEAQFRGDSDSGLKTLINNKRKNMALIDWWKQGAGIPWPVNGGTRNEIVQFPHGGNFDGIPLADGSSGDAWLCQGGADAAGGWNNGQMAPLNPDKTYRFVVPIAHLGGAGSRNAYWGVNGVCDLNTTNENGNPYFAVAGNMTPNRWHLFVGYLFPRNSNSKTHDGAGVWDAVTGAKVADGNNWTFKPDGSQPVHRAYQYYAYNGSFSAFGRPVVEEVDGSETNIAAILAAKQKAFAVDARVSDEATASANRDNALAGRIGTTEAQLNGSQGSWMAGRINDVDTASASRDSALAQRATTLEAAALVGSSSARNDHFAMWRDGQQHPDNWILWNSEGNYRTERVSGNGGSPYAVRTLNDNANVESGFYQQVPVYAGKWIVEVTAESDGSGFSGAGMTLHGVFNIDFLGDEDTNKFVGDKGNAIRTWNKSFDFDQNFVNNIGGTVNFHAMVGWTGFGRYRSPKYMKWHKMSLRPAGYGDAESFRANARITDLATTTANADSALSNRVSTTEANYSGVRNDLNTWNNDRYNQTVAVDARVAREETARADAVSAVANRTSVVEAQVSNDSNNLVRNGTFNAPGWGHGGGIPPYWGGWAQDNGAYIGTTDRTSMYGAPYPLQIDRNGYNNGITQRINGPLAPGWYAFEVDVVGEDGNWSGSGIHCNFNNGSVLTYGFAVNADTAGRYGDIGNATRRFTVLFKNEAQSDGANIYLMSGWEGFQGRTNFGFVRIVWHRIVMRPATAGEIKAQQVDNLTARVSTTESAVSNLNGRTAAYWQVQAVAGNNRAQMTVRADANGGAGVDIVGDVNFSGNLNVGADSGGNRMKITNQNIQVYDGNGTRRVAFGLNF